MKDDRLYLIHIQEAAARIEGYVADGKQAFMHSPLIQDAVMRNFQTIGQSAARISDERKEAHPAVDWRGIVNFRNVLVHDYLGVNLTRVWEVIEGELPALKRSVEEMLKQIPEENAGQADPPTAPTA